MKQGITHFNFYRKYKFYTEQEMKRLQLYFFQMYQFTIMDLVYVYTLQARHYWDVWDTSYDEGLYLMLGCR